MFMYEILQKVGFNADLASDLSSQGTQERMIQILNEAWKTSVTVGVHQLIRRVDVALDNQYGPLPRSYRQNLENLKSALQVVGEERKLQNEARRERVRQTKEEWAREDREDEERRAREGGASLADQSGR